MTKKTKVKRKSRTGSISKKGGPENLNISLPAGHTPSSVHSDSSVKSSVIKWMGTGDLALRCGVTSQTIRNDIERGKIIAQQTRSGRHIISKAEADRYIQENGYSFQSATLQLPASANGTKTAKSAN